MVIMQQPPEMTVAYLFTEHLAGGPRLMEMTLERGNMFTAIKRVRGNKGAPGIDNMTVDQLPGYLRRIIALPNKYFLDLGLYLPGN